MPTSTAAFTATNATMTPVGASSAPAPGSYIVLAQDSEGAASPFNSAAAISSLTLTNAGVTTYKSGDQVVLDSYFDGTNYDLIAEDVAAP